MAETESVRLDAKVGDDVQALVDAAYIIGEIVACDGDTVELAYTLSDGYCDKVVVHRMDLIAWG